MHSEISTLKIIVENKMTNLPISGVNVSWAIIPSNKSAFSKKFKDSERELQIDVTNQGGFSLLLGKLGHDTKLCFYIHKIACPGFKEINLENKIENKLSVKGGSEKEFLVYLYPYNE